MVSLDISKAFYRVWHQDLLAKPSKFGFPSAFVPWTTSFLSTRPISVRVDEFLYQQFLGKVGVPDDPYSCPLSSFYLLTIFYSIRSVQSSHSSTLPPSVIPSLTALYPANINIDYDCNSVGVSLNSNLVSPGSRYHVNFSELRTPSLSISHKHHFLTPLLLDLSISIPLTSISLSCSQAHSRPYHVSIRKGRTFPPSLLFS